MGVPFFINGIVLLQVHLERKHLFHFKEYSTDLGTITLPNSYVKLFL